MTLDHQPAWVAAQPSFSQVIPCKTVDKVFIEIHAQSPEICIGKLKTQSSNIKESERKILCPSIIQIPAKTEWSLCWTKTHLSSKF